MRRPAQAVGMALIALISTGWCIGCARVKVVEVRPETAARAVRHVLDEHPLGHPRDLGPTWVTGDDPQVLCAGVDLEEARHREVFSRDKAIRLYAQSMEMAWRAIDDPASPDRGRAVAIYNRALDRFLRLAGGHRFRFGPDWFHKLEEQGVHLAVRQDASVWDPDRFDEIRFSGDFVSCGMANFYGAHGLGVPLIAVRHKPAEPSSRRRGPERFSPYFEVYPVTAILRFSGPGASPMVPLLELHDPLRFGQVDTVGGPLTMAADLTTPTAYHFARGRLSLYERLSLFTPQSVARATGLHMLQPYEPGKIPVVLIHGLGSSPLAWGRVVNELRGDPELRARYQFWIYMYPTGIPFLLSAADLRRELIEARATVDPSGADPAFDRMVLVGHSMGGLLSKLLITESGQDLWSLNSREPFERMSASPEHRDLLGRVFFFQPLGFVRRVVFIATPHRGSRLGSELIGRLGDRLIRIPGPLAEAHAALIAANPPEFFTPEFLKGVPSSIDELTFENPYLLAIDRLPRAPWVEAHSIIGRVGRRPLDESSDGVVPYGSSHVEWAASETIIDRMHFLQDDPLTIEELRRILRLHLSESGG